MLSYPLPVDDTPSGGDYHDDFPLPMVACQYPTYLIPSGLAMAHHTSHSSMVMPTPPLNHALTIIFLPISETAARPDIHRAETVDP